LCGGFVFSRACALHSPESIEGKAGKEAY